MFPLRRKSDTIGRSDDWFDCCLFRKNQRSIVTARHKIESSTSIQSIQAVPIRENVSIAFSSMVSPKSRSCCDGVFAEWKGDGVFVFPQQEEKRALGDNLFVHDLQNNHHRFAFSLLIFYLENGSGNSHFLRIPAKNGGAIRI